MAARKQLILLRRAPFSGEAVAIHRYKIVRGVVRVSDDGKQDITADFNDLVLTTLLDGDDASDENCPSPDIVKALDYAVQLMLEQQERDPGALDLAGQTQAFRLRLIKIVEEHNERSGSDGPHGDG